MLGKKGLTEYRSVVGQLNWISLHTMPDISYNISELSKSFKEGTREDMRKLIKVVREVKSIMGGVVINEKRKTVVILSCSFFIHLLYSVTP